jgi:PTH1 family peptidyl-tRNA hydrolase
VKLIVGLGNPGPQYVGTRHNVGFDVVDRLAHRWRIELSSEKFHGWFGLGMGENERVALLKPTTFMNRSGRSVLAAGRFYKLEAADLLVVTDDLALDVGRLRMRAKGSAGGHNGLSDILRVLGTDEWARLRIGIGAALGNPSSYVLSRFGPDEEPLMQAAYDRAVDAVACWLTDGPELAMTRFNVKSG